MAAATVLSDCFGAGALSLKGRLRSALPLTLPKFGGSLRSRDWPSAVSLYWARGRGSQCSTSASPVLRLRRRNARYRLRCLALEPAFDIRAEPTATEVSRRERALARPAEQRSSVDANDAQNLSHRHTLVQGGNAIGVVRCSLERGFAAPGWRGRGRKPEEQLLWGSVAPTLRSYCFFLSGHGQVAMSKKLVRLTLNRCNPPRYDRE